MTVLRSDSVTERLERTKRLERGRLVSSKSSHVGICLSIFSYIIIIIGIFQKLEDLEIVIEDSSTNHKN
jgi:hypothetical protein